MLTFYDIKNALIISKSIINVRKTSIGFIIMINFNLQKREFFSKKR